jgi:hypothetical protein
MFAQNVFVWGGGVKRERLFLAVWVAVVVAEYGEVMTRYISDNLETSAYHGITHRAFYFLLIILKKNCKRNYLSRVVKRSGQYSGC